jgi:hypothetical protein
VLREQRTAIARAPSARAFRAMTRRRVATSGPCADPALRARRIVVA